MHAGPAPLVQAVLQKALPLALSFLDDALILALSRLGLSLPWLQSLGAILLSLSLLYWAFRIGQFCYNRYTVRHI